MNKSEDLPFKIGTMWHGDGVPSLSDAPHLEGKEYYIEDINHLVSGVKTYRTGRFRKVRCVRNIGVTVLLPKLLAKFGVAGLNFEYGSQMDGFCAAPTDKGYPVDEFLPATGVPQYALFWMVIEGPAMVTTLAASPGTIVVGSSIVPGAGGKVGLAGTLVYPDSNFLGRSYKATSAINTDILVDIGAR